MDMDKLVNSFMAHTILVTAQIPNFSFPFWIWLLGTWGLDFGLGLDLGLVNKDC